MSRVVAARIAVVALAVAALEILCRTGVIGRFTLIAPSEMAVALWQMIASGSADADIAFTATNIAAAFAIAIAAGFAMGGVLHALPRLRHAATPLLAAYYAVPTFVFYPLLVVAFGAGRAALIVMGASFGVVVMIVQTLNGLDHVPPAVAKTAAMLKLSPLRRFVLVRLPAAAPHLVTGIKLAVAYSVIGEVAGEFILATEGMGKKIGYAYDNFDNRTMYGLLLLLLLFVLVVNGSLAAWEKRLHRRFGQT
jgi:NitT/TauT family transport system permease protein